MPSRAERSAVSDGEAVDVLHRDPGAAVGAAVVGERRLPACGVLVSFRPVGAGGDRAELRVREVVGESAAVLCAPLGRAGPPGLLEGDDMVDVELGGRVGCHAVVRRDPVPGGRAALAILSDVFAVPGEDGLAGVAGALLDDPVGEFRSAVARDVHLGRDGQLGQFRPCFVGGRSAGNSAEAVAEEGALGAAQLGEPKARRLLVASPVATAVAQWRIIIVMPTTVAGPATVVGFTSGDSLPRVAVSMSPRDRCAEQAHHRPEEECLAAITKGASCG